MSSLNDWLVAVLVGALALLQACSSTKSIHQASLVGYLAELEYFNNQTLTQKDWNT